MHTVASIRVSPRSRHLSSESQAMVSKLLWIELLLTIPLDIINELMSHAGIPVPLGQLVRGLFIAINVIAVLEFGSRKEAQITVLVVLFYAMMVLREVSLGLNAMAYAATYWAKFLSFFLTFLAIKSAGDAGMTSEALLDRFFFWSIRLIPLSYIVLAIVGVLEQSGFDSGYGGDILSKNSMSAVLLLFLSLSLYYVFQRKMAFIWPVTVAIALFLLGSKSTIVFCAAMIVACVLHELRGLSLRSICMAGVLVIGLCVGAWLFWDELSLVIDTQFKRYQYVTTSQGGSFVDYLLTGRNDLLQAGLSGYFEQFSPIFLVVGGGISSLGSSVADLVNSSSSIRGIEMDFFEIPLASGLIGLLVMVAPYLITIRKVHRGRPSGHYYLVFGILVQFLFMMLGGHVVTEGMPAEYLGILLAYSCLASKAESPEANSQTQISEMDEKETRADALSGVHRPSV